MAIKLKSEVISRAGNMPRAGMDPILYRANGGVRHLVDFGLPFCREKIAPTDTQTVLDISGWVDQTSTLMSGHYNGQMQVGSPGYVDYADNGLHFADAVGTDNYYEVPVQMSTAMMAGNQRFLVWMFVKFPALADFPSLTTPAPFLAFSNAVNGLATDPEVVRIALSTITGTKYLGSARQRGSVAGVSEVDAGLIPLNDTDCDKINLVAFWRDGTDQRLYMRNSLRPAKTASIADGGLNTVTGANALTGKFGIGPAHWPGYTGAQRDWAGYRLGIADLDACRDVNGDTPWNYLDELLHEEWEWFHSAERAALIGAAA